MNRDLVLVGVIVAAHGIRGEVKLRSFTADPSALASYSPLETAKGAKIEIQRMRPQKDGFIAILKGVTDRNAAEALKGTELFVPRERLPEPDEDEVYVHDLIGLAVETAAGAAVGTVKAVLDFGAGDVLEIAPPQGDTLLVPFTKAAVPVVDLPGGRLVIDPVAALPPEGGPEEREEDA